MPTRGTCALPALAPEALEPVAYALRFDTFGQRVLDNAWNGFHCCLFAYGQTGAGKSYSMVGPKP